MHWRPRTHVRDGGLRAAAPGLAPPAEPGRWLAEPGRLNGLPARLLALAGRVRPPRRAAVPSSTSARSPSRSPSSMSCS